MSNKGFTLIESLLVLSVLTILLLAYPVIKPTNTTILHYQMQMLYQRLQKLQFEAMTQKKEKHVDFQGNHYTLGQVEYLWSNGISCSDTSFHFTPMGSVSHATTIHCTLKDARNSILIELGTGRMYVR